MAIIFVCYFIVSFLIIKFKKNKIKFKNFPNLTLKKDKIVFNSKFFHRIKYNFQKVLLIGNVLYIKTLDDVIKINNVSNVMIYENYLYFQGLGDVEICVDCSLFYKYFAIEIRSDQFDVGKIKQMAIEDFINSEFDIKFSKILKKYINLIKNVLKINIFKEKIEIKSNSLNLHYELIYKINGVIKKVII